MLYVLNTEIYDENGPMSVYCLLYEDSMNAGISKLFTHTQLLDVICEKYNIKVVIVQGEVKCANTVSQMIIPVCITNTETDLTQIKVCDDLTALLSQPDTAIRAILQTRSDAGDDMLEVLYENFQEIKKIKKSTKVMLKPEHFLDPALAESMITNRPTYHIASEKNVDIFQKSSTDTVCLALPSIEDIMDSAKCVDTRDVLYLTAPYRMQTKISNGYMSILHTPFFRNAKDVNKVYSQSAVNSVSAQFRWLYGIAKNNMLPIQPNERQLFDNLETLYCEDITMNMESILSGIFYQSRTGRKLQKLEGLSKSEFVSALQMILMELDPFVTFTISMEDAFNLADDIVITKQTMLDFFNGRIKINQEGAVNLLDNPDISSHIINCNPYTVTPEFENLDDGIIVNKIISNGFITRHMYDFFGELCMIAYRVNWGHSAVTKAIPGLIASDKVQDFDNKMITRLNEMASGKSFHRDIFEDTSSDDDEDDMDADDIEENFTQYLSNITITKIKNAPEGIRLLDDPTTMNSLTPKERLIERWRFVNGESRLLNFIGKGYVLYHDPKLLILAFIKLLRWGEERKPTMLVFPEYPEITTVFDLNEAAEVENIYMVSEKDLIMKDGCRYTMVAGLYTDAPIINSSDKALVGFLLAEDYGKIQKYYVASWEDLTTLVSENKCDISNLKLSYSDITPLFSNMYLIETELSGLDYEFFVTEKKISDSVAMNCQASQLSECILLLEKDLTKSSEFIKSSQRSTIISLRDKQYDVLHRYIRKLSMFYRDKESAIANLHNSSQADNLIQLVAYWGTLEENDGKPLHNEVVGANTLSKLQFTNGTSNAYAKYENLTNVTLVADLSMESGLDPIAFKDKTLAAISAQLQNKVVMCMGLTSIDGKPARVFFRSDSVTVADLETKPSPKTGKQVPSILQYNKSRSVIDNLKNKGEFVTEKFIYLCDESLRGLI